MLLLCVCPGRMSPAYVSVLGPNMVVYVCPDSPVSEADVYRAVTLWDYPTPIGVKAGSAERCSAAPGLSETHVRLIKEGDREVGDPEIAYALTLCTYEDLRRGVMLFTSCTVMLPHWVDPWTVVHEVGHVTGRDHTDDPHNVMYPKVTQVPKHVEPWTQAEYDLIWVRATQ